MWCVVHQQGAGCHGGQNTFSFDRNRPYIAIIANAEEHNLGIHSRFGRGGAEAVVLVRPGKRLGLGAVIDTTSKPLRLRWPAIG